MFLHAGHKVIASYSEKSRATLRDLKFKFVFCCKKTQIVSEREEHFSFC